MLAELLPRSYNVPFGDAELELRYTLRSFLALEQVGHNYLDIFRQSATGKVILEFFAAGLVTPVKEKKLLDIAEIIGYSALWDHIKGAVLQAMPKKEENVVQKPPTPNDEEFSFTRLRVLICDIMGKDEDFFWNSTLGELIERWTEYARAMGYAEEPERVLEFDEEGM